MAFILVWLSFGLIARATATATCWTAAGQIAPNDQSCYPNEPKHSFCCPGGAVCLSNKLCKLPGGQAHRGSCTDRTWGRECPHFCLNEHTGNDGLTGVNVTLCNTNPTSSIYCCNDWTGRSCDCANVNTPKVTVTLFKPMVTIAAENSKFQETPEAINRFYHIPWNTIGPIIATVMSFCVLSMLVYLARMAYIAKRKKDPTRNHSFMEHGRRFSDYFWRASFDENGRINSKFSIGTLDTDADGMERKMSTKSLLFSVGRGSKSEGGSDAAPLLEMLPPVFRNDMFAHVPSRPSLTGTPSNSLPGLTGRPAFKRQDTDVAPCAR